MATDAVCVICGAVEVGAKCALKHPVCPGCFRAYSRAFAKMGLADDTPCAVDGCDAVLVRKKDDGKSITPGVRLVTLKAGDDEYKTIADKFGASMDAKLITALYRVENPALKSVFELCKARIEKEGRRVAGRDLGANEMLLFHATTRAACGGIMREGFDMRRAGQAHGTALGPGAYFAIGASFSHGYSKQDGKGHRTMLVCRVLLGDTGGRDSTTDGAHQYVVNREQQCLPVYMITYNAPAV